MNKHKDPRNQTFATVVSAVVIAAVALLLLWVATDPADGATSQPQQPYGGCKEAWQAPKSEGADECRDLGWTVKARLVLNKRGVIRYYNLDACTYEDGSGSGRTCGWLGNDPAYGNGHGMSFYVTGPEGARRGHYFWAPSPVFSHPHRQWVDQPLADALAEGDSPHATTRNWERCWTRGDSVTCADGYRETW